MTDITIPPEAVKALRAALTACDCDECLADMIRAMLRAWPGAIFCDGTGRDASTITLPHGRWLPLPQESRDE